MSSYNNEIAVSNSGGEASLPPLTSIKEQTTRESKKMSPSAQNKNVGATIDKLFRLTTMFFAFLVFILLFGIILTLFIGSLPALKAFGPSFLQVMLGIQ